VSAGAQTVTVPARFERPARRSAARSAVTGRTPIRLATFAALGLYGVQRWATLVRPAPELRLLGMLALAVALAGAVPWLRRWHWLASAVVALGLVLAAFPVAGLRWHWVTHLRIAVSVDRIGDGLQALPNALVPYLGAGHAVRLVIVLGAAVLLLDAAAVMAFAPKAFGDARRAAAALPLIALAVVPSTLVRPSLPYLQGLLLFALLAAFMWGERVRRDSAASALAIAALAGVGGAILAPRIDQHKPWVDYRAWAGTQTRQHLDTFNWNQTYGPLHWPRTGHEVLTVQARSGDYWKAEDLDTFDGRAWVSGTSTIEPPLPSPSPAAAARWTQDIRVTLQGMQTTDVIAAGYAGQPTQIAGGIAEGADPGTWVTGRTLGPGTTYEVSTYSPHPSPTELIHAGRKYPDPTLSNDLTLSIPVAGIQAADFPQVTFGPFHSRHQPSLSAGRFAPDTARLVSDSPYGGAYALARQLAARARTPYAFVTSVERYLARGFTYNEKPPVRAYPLESFLFKDKTGYCQQFSGAMALLLRMGGIPARVASGFTSGSYDTATRQWVVSDIDAHAWVEVWFPRYGWVRFDPTPTSAPARGGASSIPLVKTLGGLSQGAPGAPRREIGASSTPGGIAHPRSAGGTSPVLIAALVALAIALAVSWRAWRGSGRSSDDLLAELERALSRTRRPLEDGVTLVSLEHRFRSSPGAAGYVRSLRLARYGSQSAPPSAAQRRALRNELRIGLGLIGRMRALWALPPRLRRTATRRGGGLK
jgi:protein-glutamine gamma-glutamyltransferase